MVGQIISQYKILEKLGEGGMGVVYKAHDTKLDRFVALKFLPSHLAASEQDKARFIQEAKSASALNHPNVCTIHDISEFEGQLFIVMEFVDGKSLKDKKEQLGAKQILEIGIQVAEGLAAAHEKGIVHRDIKPDNIMIRKDGIVQIMDFGLAKLYTSGNVSRLTKAGTTMGTMGYMSPEQVQGLDVDHRTDIFSLGVVMYELLAGESPFKGIHETAIMYEIVNVDPAPISAVKEGTDPELDHIILECLQKEKDDRCQSAKELAKDLRKIKKSTGQTNSRAYSVLRSSGHTSSAQKASGSASSSFVLEILNRRFDVSRLFNSTVFPWVIVFGLFALLVTMWMLRTPAEDRSIVKFSLDIGDDKVLDINSYPALSISHDGSLIVYKANNKFFIRKLSSMESTPVEGIENASSPFFSADDKWLIFFRNGKMEKISVTGGTSITLAEAPDNRGGTAGGKGMIVFSPFAVSELKMVSDGGGAAKSITAIDTVNNERTHRWPSFLPDGKHVLFTVGLISSPDYYENARIDVVNIETGERKTVFRGASNAKYVSTGHLLFSRSGVLFIVPFDAGALEVTGHPLPIIQGVYSETTTGITNYVVSDNGTLVYLPGAVEGESRKIVKIGLKGDITVIDSGSHPYIEPKLSPDNKKLAVVIRDGENFDIWIYELASRTLNKLTFGGLNRTPLWSPDGKMIAFFRRTKDGKTGIYVKPSDGSGEDKLIYDAKDIRVYLNHWSRDGKFLLVDNLTKNSQSDLLVVPLVGDTKPWKYLETPRDEYESTISPNGKWVSYLTDETGSYQIFVRSFPGKEGKWQISTDVAEEPRWSPDGRFLFYRKSSQLMAVPVNTDGTFSAGVPVVLIKSFPAQNVDSGISYDITSDGKFFITTQPAKGVSYKNISVIVNWTEEVKVLTSNGK